MSIFLRSLSGHRFSNLVIKPLICAFALIWGNAQSSFAQFGGPQGPPFPGAPGGGAFQGGGLGDGGFPGVNGGGAAQADFSTLMNLIQQTIDPDSWLQAGGTSTILPYPAGVYVDPAGHLTRVQEVGLDRSLDVATAPGHPWKAPSGLRTVSLKQLDRALAGALRQGLPPTTEMARLAGLARIEYVRIDVANEDVLLAGPASARRNAPGFELQDLAVIAARINSQTSPLGCSIEPTNDGLRAAQQYLQGNGVVNQLAKNPRMVVEQMQSKIGPHQVKVFGLPANTGTAIALVDADEHMKKLGFGTVATQVQVDSYFDHLAKQNKVPDQSMIRWWFSYADEPIRTNPQQTVFQLPEQCAAVLSEQQWITQQGRAPTGGQDKAADAFAAGITEKLDDLRLAHPSYARLNAVFELGLALQIAIESTGQPNLEAWLPTLCSLGMHAPETNTRPQSVEGLTTWKKLPSGTVVAVVSGGVKLDPTAVANKDAWETDRFLASSVIPMQPDRQTTSHGAWWWDAR